MVLQVTHAVFVHMMSDQGEWDDKRCKPAAKIVDERRELFPFGRCKLFGKITDHVMKHITVLFYGRMDGEALHEKAAVLLIGFGDG